MKARVRSLTTCLDLNTRKAAAAAAAAASRPPVARRLYSAPAAASPAKPDARFIEHIRQRLGRCLAFGLAPDQVHHAGLLLQTLAEQWRALSTGVEGFIARRDWAGVWRGQARWGDMDSMGHINNVVYNRWSETGRVNWCYQFARRHDPAHAREWEELLTPRGAGLILKSIRTDFKFPMKFPDHVTVIHRLAARPDPAQADFQLQVVLLSEKHQRPAARCAEDITLYDYRAGKKMPLAQLPFLATAFDVAWETQMAEQERVLAQRARIEAQVRALETASWDRPDAKEDLGSAGA